MTSFLNSFYGFEFSKRNTIATAIFHAQKSIEIYLEIVCTLSTTKEESIAEALCRGMLASFFYFFEKLTNFSKEASLPEMMPPSKFSFVVVFLVSSSYVE